MRTLSRHALSVCLMAMCLFMAANWASAQVNTADILGTVTDAGGAVIPNVKVTVTNTATNDTKTVTTNSTGDYIVNLMPSGSYTITAEAPSFKRATVNLNVVSGDRARANMQLQVGDVTQTVEVAAQTPALQTDSATLSTVVGAQGVQDLPLNGRNFVTLVQSTVGVVIGPSNSILSGTRPDERRQTANIAANGQNEVFNNQMVDGMDNNEREQFTILMRPSIDMIQEVKVDTNSYPAEVGRAGGAVVNLLTKSGTNDWHGGAYEYLRNDKLNANDFFSNKSGTSRPEYRQNQFGGSFGGAIKKDKTFFFADSEALRIVQGVPTGLISTPTLFEETHPGDFRDQVGGILVPKLDPVGLKFFALFPAPNTGAPNAITSNYNQNVTKTYNSTTYDARVDHRFSDKDSMFGRFSYNPTFNSQPSLFPPVNGVTAGGGIYPGPSNADSQSYMLDYVHIFSPTLVMELKGGFTRLNLLTASPDVGKNVASTVFGMPNTDVNANITGLPAIQLTGFVGTGSDFTLGNDNFVPIYDINNVFQETGTLTWTKGAHNIKYGASMIRRQLNYFQNTRGVGYFQFTGQGIGATAGTPAAPTPAPLANLENLVQGTPNEIQRQISYHWQYLRFWEPAIFIQDDWHAKSWLTLNIGLRWDHFSPITDAQGQRSNFNIASAATCGTSCNPFVVGATAGVKPYWTNFEPRLGFAANPRKNLVIRGGFGMSRFAQDFASTALNNYNAPFISQTINCFPATGTGATACPAGSGTLAQGAPLAPIPALNNLVPGVVQAHAVDYPNAYIIQYNLTVQKQFGANVVSAGYVGEVGRHLQWAPNINVPAPSTGALRPLVYSGVFPNVTNINYSTASGSSEYNSAQFSFERRYAKGLTVNVNYTFARNLTNITDGGATVTAAAGSILPYNRSYDWGNSDIGIKNRVSFRFNYELPFGKSSSRMMKLAIGGWQMNSLAFWQSGTPFTVVSQALNPARTNATLVTTDRPNVVPGQSYAASGQNYTNWINLNAFALQPLGSPGSESHDQLYGPQQRNLDFSLFKDFQLKERMKLQFRAEVYNLTNTENFGLPNVAIQKWVTNTTGSLPLNTGQFGQITASNAAMNPRLFQFALKLIF
jgi:hypothetical protein